MSISGSLRSVTAALFRPLVIERKQAVTLSSALATLTHAMSSFEHLMNRRERRPGGANDWSITNNSANFRNPITRRAIDLAARPAVTDAIHVSRLAACIVKVTPRVPTVVRGALDLYLSATSVLLAPRHHYGGDGSDQLASITTAMTGISRVSGDSRVTDAALWGLSLQGSLAYFVSGWVKLAGPRWRNGTALLGVMRTRVYGHERFWQLLNRFPWLGRTLERTTVGLEAAFPLVYFAQGRLTRVAILSAGSMHAGIVITMALGRFFPAFSSLYPAIAYTTVPKPLLSAKRHDAVPVAFASLGLLAGVALQIDKALRARAARRPLPGFSHSTLPSGAQVTIHREDPPGSENKPAVVMVHGLGSSAALWSTTASGLTAAGFSHLAYERERTSTATASDSGLSAEVAELTELIGVEYPDRPVILLGHSLGGLIAYRAAQQLAAQVHGVVLLDSSHPRQLRHSALQRDMTANVKSVLAITAASLSAGFGRLMSEPGWIRQVPAESREALATRSRDPRFWWRAHREWLDAEDDFRRNPEPGPADFPVLSITAENTQRLDPVIADLHRDYAQQSSTGRHMVVEGFHHNDIVFSAGASATLVREIASMTGAQEVRS